MLWVKVLCVGRVTQWIDPQCQMGFYGAEHDTEIILRIWLDMMEDCRVLSNVLFKIRFAYYRIRLQFQYQQLIVNESHFYTIYPVISIETGIDSQNSRHHNPISGSSQQLKVCRKSNNKHQKKKKQKKNNTNEYILEILQYYLYN